MKEVSDGFSYRIICLGDLRLSLKFSRKLFLEDVRRFCPFSEWRMTLWMLLRPRLSSSSLSNCVFGPDWVVLLG